MSYGGGSGGSSKIATAGDAALSNPANGDVLAYDTSVQKWKNLAGKVTATVDGVAVNTLALSSSVSAADVGAMPAPVGTPSIGQVPVVSAVSPLALGWGSAGSGSSGGSSSGGTGSATAIRPETYGAKSDGVILSELSLSAGNKSISSSNAPFTNTATDAGKVIYWRTGNSSYEQGVIATVQSATQATLASNPNAGAVVDSGPNGCGVVGTDSTSAFNQAYAAAQAPSLFALSKSQGDGFWRQSNTPGRQVLLSSGVYIVKPLTTMTGWNVYTLGEGMNNTIIACCEPGVVYNIATFNQNASYAFPSTVLGWTWRDMAFVNPCQANGGSLNARTVTGIQDNGNGSMTVENVNFRALKYGYAASYGGDFSRLTGCYFLNCDVGSYFGPGGQQLEFMNCDYSSCREGAVFEGVQNWHMGGNCHWQDPVVSGVTIEGKPNGSTTRFGLQSNIGGGAWYSGRMVIDGAPWFESNSGNNGGVCPRLIWINGDGPYGPAFTGFVVRDALLISGGTQVGGASTCFVELNTSQVADQPVIIDNLSVGGSYINYLFNSSGVSGTKPLIKDCIYDTSKIQVARNTSAYKLIREDGYFHGFTSF